MARCGDIIDKTLQTLQSTGDGDDSRWTRDEIFGYLNEGQAEIAAASKCFRRILSLPAGYSVAGGSTIIPLPEDSVGVRWVQYNRKFIEPASYRELRQRFGPEFLTVTGAEPIYWYNDLSGPLEIRLYPNPTTIARRFINFRPAASTGSFVTPTDGNTYGVPRFTDSTADTVEYVDENGDAFASVADRRGYICRIEGDDETFEFAEIPSPLTGKEEPTLTPSVTRKTKGPHGEDIPPPQKFTRGSPFQRAIGPAINTLGGRAVMGFQEALLVNYAYIPQPYKSENDEILLPDNHEAALIWWMLHRCYEKSTAQEDIDRSNRFFDKFAGRLKMTETEQSRSFSTRSRKTTFRSI